MQAFNSRFEPERHKFRKLNIKGPGDLIWFERRLDDLDLRDPDAWRLHVYLTMDGTFTTLWYGLLDPFIAKHKLGVFNNPYYNHEETHHYQYFRGYIGDDRFGEEVLAAIRAMQMTAAILRMSEEHGLECLPLAGTG
ncbi:hypothetical protein OCH239_15780 [Roseivivax halodurans JCM 10272]|uniref:Uncharacterized protein n=1 Tax=Roseivivax halodurans JCM 10272 TaxID=1449350 RepID=X7EK26_9RHOB|nr:hypothetical protein [Roseivivax halodurans]ETX15493.1 hypothetical protein OCH239_15780 [Roseivivax halodurans JCM 10272]